MGFIEYCSIWTGYMYQHDRPDQLLMSCRWLPDHRLAITAHFILHGIHHYLPMDKKRTLISPPILFILAIPFYNLTHLVFFYDWYAAIAVFCGGLFGYICYELLHYSFHHIKQVLRTIPVLTFMLITAADFHHGADRFRNCTCNTIMLTTRMGLASPARFGTRYLAVSWKQK